MRVFEKVNVAFGVAVLCGLCTGQGRLTGLVRDADRLPVAAAGVAFHALATAGVVGLRSDGEHVRTWQATTDGNGRFELALPAGSSGSLVVDSDAGFAVIVNAVAGDLVAIDLQPHLRQRLRLRGLTDRDVTILYEGPATLPSRSVRVDGRGEVECDRVPGHELLILAPAGRVEQRSQLPWAAVGEAGELAFVEVPVHASACEWARLQDVPLAAADQTWGGAKQLWIGQDRTGQPWVGDGDGGATVQTGRQRIEVTGSVPVGALLVQAATVVHAGTGHFFSVIRRPHGSAWLGVPGGEPFLTVAGEGAERIIGPGGASAPARLDWPAANAAITGVVLGDDRLPVRGASVLVRPRAAVPTRAGSVLSGVMTTTRASGGFRVPHRFADGRYSVVVVAPDGRWYVGDSVVAGGKSAPVQVRLATGASIRGVVADLHGNVVAGVPVWAWSGREPMVLSSANVGPRTFTDSDGRFEIAGLQPDLSYEVGCDTRARGHVTVNGVRPGTELLQLPLADAPPRPR